MDLYTPWTWKDETHFSELSPITILDSRGEAIGAVGGTGEYNAAPTPEEIATATMMVAAPALLAALKDAANWIRCELGGRLPVEALANAEAAIAAAEPPKP